MADRERVCKEVGAWIAWREGELVKHFLRPEVARTQTLTEAQVKFGADAFCVWKRQAGPDGQQAA